MRVLVRFAMVLAVLVAVAAVVPGTELSAPAALILVPALAAAVWLMDAVTGKMGGGLGALSGWFGSALAVYALFWTLPGAIISPGGALLAGGLFWAADRLYPLWT